MFSLRPEEPDQKVSRRDGGKGEGDGVFHKCAGGNFIALLAQNADACDIFRRADGRQIASYAE